MAYSSLNSDRLTRPIIGAAIEVHRTLGPGFLESIYRNALLHELQLRGMATQCELGVEVGYKELVVGKHRLDLLVEGIVVVELKAVAGINAVHIAQILSYIRAVRMDTGLVINFGEDSLRWKRILISHGLNEFNGFNPWLIVSRQECWPMQRQPGVSSEASLPELPVWSCYWTAMYSAE